MSKKSKRTKILFLYWGKKGGGAKYSLEISKELAGMEEVDLFLSISTVCEISDQFNKLEVPILTIDTYRNVFGFMYQYLFGIYKVQQKLEKYLRDNGIDVVITGMDFFWGSKIHQVCRTNGVRSVFVVHEPKPHPQEPMLMSFFKKRELKRSIESADHLVVLTDHVKQEIQDQYKVDNSTVSVIPHGIFSYYKAPTKKSLPGDNEKITILYFGRVEYYKGLDILLDAFEELEIIFGNLKLEIWGSGDLSEYQTKIKQIENIEVNNSWIDEEMIPDIFKRADICVLPYRDASQSGIAGIACMAGVPIVATPTEGLKQQLKDAEVVFSKDFSPSSLATAIEKLISDPEFYSHISEAEINYATRLSWSSIAKEFLGISSTLNNE